MRQLPILMYHWFRGAGSRSESRSPQLEITPELFERQMQWLADRGYRTVGLERAIGFEDNAGLPDKPIVITFDDGTLDFWEYGKPILERFGFTATLFVVTGYVGKDSSWDLDLGEPARRLMSWEQIIELQRDGHEIGSHCRSHRPLTQLTPDQAAAEMHDSRAMLQTRLGAAPEFLAYPRGFYGEVHKRIAIQAGYRGACAVILRWRDLLHSDEFELKRMTIKGTDSMLRFRLRVCLSRWVRFAKR